MAIELPESALEVEQRSKTDVQRELNGSDPFLKNSVVGALVTSSANRTYDFYLQLDVLQEILMPDTSVGEFLQRWGAIYGIIKLAATQSTGVIPIGGVAGGVINSGTLLTTGSGEIYETTAASVVVDYSLSVTSIERSGSIATVTTSVDHNLSTKIPVTITGADQPEYNIVGGLPLGFPSSNQFTLDVSGSPATPATGTIIAEFTLAILPVESQRFQDSTTGINVNLESGTEVSLQSPIVNIDNTANVGAVPIGGGSDQETDAQMLIRLLNRIQNPVAHFNVADIENKVFEIAGVTRVFVQEVTPVVGAVTVYFMRDNDADPIPDAGEVTTTKDHLLTIKPANTSDSDVIVLAPTAVPTDFTFTLISPDTPTMRTAISENLAQFFAEETTIETDVQQDAYRSAIQNTIDQETGDRVLDFTLSTPVGDIPITTGEIGTLGTVTYP